MLRVKGMDGFCPIGPGLVSGVDVRQSTLRSYKNGKMVQEGAVSEQIFDCGYLIADLARHITFLPGDILLTGTPANSRPLEAGDTIDIEVTGVGRLSNTVVETPAPRAPKASAQPRQRGRAQGGARQRGAPAGQVQDQVVDARCGPCDAAHAGVLPAWAADTLLTPDAASRRHAACPGRPAGQSHRQRCADGRGAMAS